MRRAIRILLLTAATGCATAPAEAPEPRALRSWAIQLQGLARPGAVEALESSPAGLVVIEATRTVRGQEDFPTRDVVRRLKDAGKRVLAYVNVGQAEDYRVYWRAFWRAPTAQEPGHPSYLLALDPEGWPGNYPVAFWDIRWQANLWGSRFALVDQALADGFDGVFLDWVLGYSFGPVVAAAEGEGIDPARAMATLVRDLRAYARRKNPRFLVVPLNAAALAETVPEFLDSIDGIAQEPFTFTGDPAAQWDEPEAGDIPVAAADTERWERQLRVYRGRGLPVFTVDYALEESNAAAARRRSEANGFVPCVSRTPLDRLP